MKIWQKIIANSYVKRGLAGSDGLKPAATREKWRCSCGKQCTRRRIFGGKEIVICSNCELVRLKK